MQRWLQVKKPMNEQCKHHSNLLLDWKAPAFPDEQLTLEPAFSDLRSKHFAVIRFFICGGGSSQKRIYYALENLTDSLVITGRALPDDIKKIVGIIMEF